MSIGRLAPLRGSSLLRQHWLNPPKDRIARPLWSSQQRYSHAASAVRADPTDSLEALEPSNTSSRFEAIRSAKPFSEFLTDTFDRHHDYLRISITEKCNLRCLYCMPEEGVPLSPKKHLLTPPEILYISQLFVSQGVSKIRLTGGEPTIHPQILPLLHELGALRSRGLKELALTTNGLTLPRKLDSMIEAGVTGINLSLDTLDPFQFEIMTRRRGFDQVMKSIDQILAARKAGVNLKLKVNIVIIRGLNDSQVLPFIEFTRDRDLEVRFIEYMPFDGNRWSSQKMFTYQEMLDLIRSHYPDVSKVQDHPNDTSKTYQIPGFAGRLGFITSMTDHFCGTCNRLRITSDGNLKVCLFGNAEVSLRDVLRDNFNNGEPIDQQAWEAMKQVEMDRSEGRSEGGLGLQEQEFKLLDIIGQAVKRKKARHAGIGALEHMKNRPMILIDDQNKFPLPMPKLPPRRHSQSPFFRNPTPSIFHNSLTPSVQDYFYSPASSLHRSYSTQRTTSPPSRPKSTEAETPTSPSSPSVTSPSSSSYSTSSSSSSSTSSSSSDASSDSAELTHLTPSKSVHMVNLPPSKSSTSRTATARATILFSNSKPLTLIRSAALQKGDVISVARIAGIMAAKRTPDLIPLCHNIALSGVSVEVVPLTRDDALATQETAQKADSEGGHRVALDAREKVGPDKDGKEEQKEAGQDKDAKIGEHGGVRIEATVKCNGQTGVEMEALTAVTAAGLTVYDMCKAVDRGMRMEGVRVVRKSGGRSGDWVEGESVSP